MYFIFENHFIATVLLSLKDAGGGVDTIAAQENGCHYSGNDPNVLKLPDFFKCDVEPNVVWTYLDWLSRKWTEFDKNLQIFRCENHKLQFFLNVDK